MTTIFIGGILLNYYWNKYSHFLILAKKDNLALVFGYKKNTDNLILADSEIEEPFSFKYIKHYTTKGTINYFRITKIETGSLKSENNEWTHYIRYIYVEDCGFSEGQFICKDENGLFQIWDNIACRYVDYLSYNKESDEDTIEYNFWIRRDSNTNECYKAPNIKSFLEKLASARNYDIKNLN